MSTVYSTRFLNEVAPVGAGAPYTVPDGFRAVVRSISITAGSSGLSVAQLYVGVSICFQANQVPPNGFVQWHGDQVGNAGERINTYLEGGSGFVLVSGFLLTETPA